MLASIIGEVIMPDQNDHDLLIALSTKMDMMYALVKDNNTQVTTQLSMLSGRITALETGDGRDSERMQAIQRDLSDSLKNASQVPALHADVANMAKYIEELKAKSNTWNIINSVAVGIGIILAWVFGK